MIFGKDRRSFWACDPLLRPRARAEASPARARSEIKSRSNSASDAKMPNTNFPVGVVVSIAAPWPVSTLRPTPRLVFCCMEYYGMRDAIFHSRSNSLSHRDDVFPSAKGAHMLANPVIRSSSDASSFSGAFMRVEMGHIVIGSDGYVRRRSCGSGSRPSQRS
jgi:hypothetical protein